MYVNAQAAASSARFPVVKSALPVPVVRPFLSITKMIVSIFRAVAQVALPVPSPASSGKTPLVMSGIINLSKSHLFHKSNSRRTSRIFNLYLRDSY